MAVRTRARPGCAQAGCTPLGCGLVLALAGVALFVFGGATGAATGVRCGATIAADAVLRRDLAWPRAPALTVRGPAALDLGGHAVRCTGRAPAAAAVRLAGAGGHVVRRVTTVSGADVGFEVRSGGNLLASNTDLRSGAYGFHVAGDRNRLEGNTSSGSAGAGFAVTGAGNELRGNTAVRVEIAGIVVTGAGNRLVGNRVVGFGPGADVRSRVGVVLAAPAGATAVGGNVVLGTGVAVHGSGEIGGTGSRGSRIGIAAVDGAGDDAIAGARAPGNGGPDFVDGGDGRDGDAVGGAHRDRVAPPPGPGCGGAVGAWPEPAPPVIAGVRTGR